MTIPGSGERRRRSTVTLQVAVKVKVSYAPSARVMPGQLTSRYLRMRLGEEDGTAVPSIVAWTVSRTRLVLQIWPIEVAKVIVTVLPAGTKHSHSCSAGVHSPDVSVTTVPMLDSPETVNVPSSVPRFSNSTSQ